MQSALYDAAGHRRSPVTMSGFHVGRAPRDQGRRYPADPPTVEEIVAVMRQAGTGLMVRGSAGAPGGRSLSRAGCVGSCWRACSGALARLTLPLRRLMAVTALAGDRAWAKARPFGASCLHLGGRGVAASRFGR